MSGTEDKSVIPNWLTEEYIGRIFNDFVSQERTSKEPIDWEIRIQAFHKDIENIATKLFKVKVTNKKDPKDVFSAIVKTLSDTSPNLFQISLSTQEKMFKREGKLYTDFLSQVSKIISKVDGCEIMLFPKLIHFNVDPLVLIIEDMTPDGFEMTLEPYSLEVCQKVFQNLGRFHALSYYVHHELKMDFSVYDNYLCQDLVKNIPIVMVAYQEFLEVVDTWEGCSDFADKLRKFKPFYCEKLVETSLEREGGLNVLNHGDSHKGNYLFRNNMKDIVLIDYQLSAWRSPAYDLITSFNCICEPEDNINSRVILLKSYHQEFRTILQKLKFSHRIPSLLDLHVEVLKSGILDLPFWSVYKPLGVISRSPPDPEDTRSFKEKFREALDSPQQRKLVQCFQTFMDRGYLECEEEEKTYL